MLSQAAQNIVTEFNQIIEAFRFNEYNEYIYGQKRPTYNIQSYIELASLNEIYRSGLTAYSPQVSMTTDIIRRPLYAHQAALVSAMYDREGSLRGGLSNGQHETLWSNYAFLGDAVGSGKTLTVLAYIAYMKQNPAHPPTKPTIHSSSTTLLHSLFSIKKEKKYCRLIIVPHTLYRQWEHAILTDTSLNVILCKSVAVLRKGNLAESIINADAVLVTNNLYQQLQDYAEEHNIRWSQLFVDEPDSIYLPATRTSFDKTADFTWLITGTWASFVASSLPYFFMNRHIVSADATMPTMTMRSLLTPVLDTEFTQIVNEDFKTIGYQNIHSRNFFEKYVTEHPLRYKLVVRCRNDFRSVSMNLPPILMQIIRCQAPITQQILQDFF